MSSLIAPSVFITLSFLIKFIFWPAVLKAAGSLPLALLLAPLISGMVVFSLLAVNSLTASSVLIRLSFLVNIGKLKLVAASFDKHTGEAELALLLRKSGCGGHRVILVEATASWLFINPSLLYVYIYIYIHFDILMYICIYIFILKSYQNPIKIL